MMIITRPEHDPTTKYLSKWSELVMKAAKSVIEAYNKSQEVGNKHLRSLMNSAADPDALYDARYLWWNLKHQVCMGDKTKKIK